MKILIISDSHGHQQKLEDVLNSESFDYVFYLGDGIRDIEEKKSDKPILKVAGNCDFFSDEPLEQTIKLGGKKFLITHGANYKVKWGLGALIKHAKEENVDYCCFGHTHTKFCETIDGIIFLNPGSLANGEYKILEI